jgi:hypothetical protein
MNFRNTKSWIAIDLRHVAQTNVDARRLISPLSIPHISGGIEAQLQAEFI